MINLAHNYQLDLQEQNHLSFQNMICGKKNNRRNSRNSRRNTNQQKLIKLNQNKFIIIMRIRRRIKKQKKIKPLDKQQEELLKKIELEKVKEESRMKYLKERELKQLKLKQMISKDEEQIFDEVQLTMQEREERELNKTILKVVTSENFKCGLDYRQSIM